jgi:hypothetical protein
LQKLLHELSGWTIRSTLFFEMDIAGNTENPAGMVSNPFDILRQPDMSGPD